MKKSFTKKEILTYWFALLFLFFGVEKVEANTLNVPTDYPTIQSAIDASVNGDEIKVAPGTYNETINFKGMAIRLYSTAGPKLTIIDGGGAQHVVQCVTSEGPDTILQGFTITGGHARGPADTDESGAGMFNNHSSPTISNCIFRDNIATYGGGMANRASSPMVTSCTFINNLTLGMPCYGGAMWNIASNATVKNCIFIDNSCDFWGGAMCNFVSSNTVADCTFSGNVSLLGAGICNFGGAPKVSNCLLTGNTAFYAGGGIGNYHSIPTIVECTVLENVAPANPEIFDSANLDSDIVNWRDDVWLESYNRNVQFMSAGENVPSSSCLTCDKTEMSSQAITNLDGSLLLINDLTDVKANAALPSASNVVKIDSICIEGTIASRWGWWGTGTDPGTTIPGTVEVTDFGVLGISLSPDGPFVDKLDIIYTQGEDYIAWAPIIYKRGFSKGISNEKYHLDPPYWGDWEIEWHVIGFSSFTLEQIDSPLGVNPGGGWSIFPGKRSPDDTLNRKAVRVTASIDPPDPDIYIVFKSFDVEDPSSDCPNRGGTGTFKSSSSGTAYVKTDENGIATDEFEVTMYPGDNFRIAAACSGSYLNRVTVIGTDLVDDQGRTLPVPDIAFDSSMITVWRDVHIEVDKMNFVVDNRVVGRISKVTNLKSKPRAKLNVDILIPSGTKLQANQYQNGTLFVDVTPDSVSELSVVQNGWNNVTVKTSTPLVISDYVGKYFEIVDDDDYNRNDDGNLVPYSDLYTWIQGNSTDSSSNLFAEAYIRLQYDGGGNAGNNQTVPFIANVPADTQAIDALIASNRQALGSDDYWVAYLLIAYQGDIKEDNDPDSERNETSGITRMFGTPINRIKCGGSAPQGGAGSFIFLETIRDIEDEYGTFSISMGVVPHELGHQFGIKGDRSGMGIMSSPFESGGFTKEHLKILRSRIKSPGHE
ncbi:MAG: right-handed parallel beta-helix repeat-containing protein [Sedimentisphaerales bacterium]